MSQASEFAGVTALLPRPDHCLRHGCLDVGLSPPWTSFTAIFPDLKIQGVNVVELMTRQPHEEHPHGRTGNDLDALFTEIEPAISAYHGYPGLIHRLVFRRTNHNNFHVCGYQEEGMTMIPVRHDCAQSPRPLSSRRRCDRPVAATRRRGGPSQTGRATNSSITEPISASTASTCPRSRIGAGRLAARGQALCHGTRLRRRDSGAGWRS